MLKDLLSANVYMAIESTFNLLHVYEVRLRRNRPIVINFGGKTYFLKDVQTGKHILASTSDLSNCLRIASENSIYACNNQIKQGFITCKDGIRLGLAGEHVLNDLGQTGTIKNIYSINIRIPHAVVNCAHTALAFMLNGGIKNTLIISPPGAGKTTFLRDIASSLSKESKLVNVLVVDERFELANCVGGEPTIDLGNCDVISGATKSYAFLEGVRTLKPDVIVCDEITTKADAIAVENAINSGVKVVCSVHGETHYSILNKPEFAFLLTHKVFERIVILSLRQGPGTYEAILNENLQPVWQAGN